MADIIIDVETRVNLRPLGDGLSAATAKASEFEKSINAANARVLAFGASAGLIYKLGEAFNGLVKSTIEVEKTLVDVNTLLNLNQKQIAEFGAELFNVAKASSQSYEMVSEAAKELARQGVGAEKVLQRTADAMNLAKLSGISASSAVETLTAVLGTFSEQGLNSATVVERLAAVDAKFAVSSEHLSEALKRSASSAVDANVSFNELIGVVTVVQERTARGGAVIGNAFKSIFTRLGRTEVLDDLANLGIAVKNTEGEILPTIQILKNLSASYSSLAPASKAFISEQVAGVYQIGTLKALMSDLSSANSRFAETQLVAANSSGSTSARINELNTSLDAYLSRLGSAGKQFGAAFGKEGLMSGMKDLVGGATGLLEMMTPDPKNSEEIGNKIGVGLMKGLGGFLTGPALLAVGVIGGKILMKFVSDVAQAASSLASIGKSMSQGQLQRQSLEQAIGREIQRQPALLDSVRAGTMSVSAAQDQILAKLREEASLRQKILASAMQMAGPLGAAGVLTTDRGAMYTRPPTKAKGFIPNFNYGQEIEDAGASEHGYTAGKAYKTKIHDGRGKSFESFVNDNEDVRTVTNSSGNLATFVTPPNGYGKGTTMAAGGFVPNFSNIKYHSNPDPDEKRFRMYTIGDKVVEKEGEDAKYQSYLQFSKAEFESSEGKLYKAIVLEHIKGKNKGDGNEMFLRLMKLAKRTKREVITEGLTPQRKRLSELYEKQSNSDKLFKIFPQLRYRDRNEYSTTGLMRGPGEGMGYRFKSIETLKERVNKKPKAAFLESLKGDSISIQELKTRALNKGFVPNFALDKVWSLAQTGTLPKKEGGYTEQQRAAVLGEMYESELLQKLPTFEGFSNVKHLSKGNNKNIEADFFARYKGFPWLIDAKRSNNEQAKLSRLAKKEKTMRALFERIKLDDKVLTSIDPEIAPLLADKMNMKLGVVLSDVTSGNAGKYKNSVKGKDLVKSYEGLDTYKGAPVLPYLNFSGGFVPNFVGSQDTKNFEAGMSDLDIRYDKSSGTTKHYRTDSGSYLKFYSKNPGEIDVGFIRSEKSGEGFAMFQKLMKLAKRTKSDVVSPTLVPQSDEIPKIDPDLSNVAKLFRIYPQIRYRDVPSKYHTTGIMGSYDEYMGYKFSSIEDLKERVEKKPKDLFLKNLKGLYFSDLRTRALSKGFVPNFANYADSVMGLEENLSGNKATFHTSPFPHVRNSSQPTFSAAMADHGGLSNALKDSMKGQKEAGLMSKGYVPNFAINPKSPIKTDSGPDLVGLARQKLIAQINIQIEEFKKGNITREGLTNSTKTLMESQKVTAESQKKLNNSINRSANAHAKAAAAAAEAPSFFSIANLKGVGKDGKPLEGAAATNRQLKLGAASMAMSMAGGQITQFTAGKGGMTEKIGQGVEGITNAASYAAMGAVFGPAGIVGGAVLGLGVAAYKIFGDTEEKAAKAAAKSKELSDSIRIAGEAMSSLKNNIALLGQASTEAEKKIISQRIVQDKINLNTGIDAAIEKLKKGGYGATEINPDLIKKLTEAKNTGNKEGGNLDEAMRLLNEASTFTDARSAALGEMRQPGKNTNNITGNIQKALLNSSVNLDNLSPEFKTYIAAKEALDETQKRIDTNLASQEGSRDAQRNNPEQDRKLAEYKRLINQKGTEQGKVKDLEAIITRQVGKILGSDFTGPENLKLVMDAFQKLGANRESVAKTVNQIKIDKEPIEKNIAKNKKSVMDAGIKAQQDSTLLNFENTQNLIEREFQLSLRNALGNIDAFSKAFEETANAIKKIEEDAKAASIADESKSFQQAQNSLNEEIKKAKDNIGKLDQRAVEYAKELQDIIDNSETTSDALTNINELLSVEYSKDNNLSPAEKEHKVALENIRDNLIKEAAASADAAKKSQNNIKIEERKGENTQRLIDAQSKYAGILSEITLSYQNLDFAIKESIKTQDERAGYALEGERLKRDFSSERMSAMGVTLSPAAAREDAYFESSRRQVEDAQIKINASQRKAGGSQDSFSNANLKNYAISEDYYAPLNKDNVDETITKIKEQLPFYEKDANQKENLEAMLKSAQAYKADSEATQSLTTSKVDLLANIKANKEAFSENTREFREQANKLEIEKMKVENKLALDSSGRKIESEKYLSRFMGPDMAQGENAAAKISEDQRLAIRDYDETLSTKNADRDRQIASLSIKAIQSYKFEEKDQIYKQIMDLEAQKVQDGKKRTEDINKINDTAFRDQTSLTDTREFDLEESQKALTRNLAKTKRQDASEIYLSQAKINSENYLSRDIRSTMGEGGSAAAKIKEDTNLQVMQSRAEVALKGTDRQLQIDDLDARRKAVVGPNKDNERADLQDKINKLTQQNVADGEIQVANEEKINALMIQRLETLEESRTLGAITNSFFVDLANASDPIANLQRDVKNLAGSMQKGFEDAFVSFVDGTASAGDAFKGFVRSIAKEMAAMSARFTANLITNSLSQLGGTAFQSAQSYFGGSQGGVVRAATGGHITGGSGVRDDIPAILTGGEYVIKKGSVNKYGVDFLEKINAQKFASGGQALSNQYTLGTFSGNYAKGDSETLRGAPTPLLGGVDLNGGSFTMGQYNIDPRLSNMALGDENNPQNRIREDMAALDMERKIAFDDYSSDKRRALESFQKQKDDAATAALINAAVQIGMAAISAKINSYAASKQTAGASKDLATFNAETSGGATASLSASGVRGGELYNQGVTSVTPGEFSFFGKSTPGSYNVGEAKLNPDQFKAYNSQMNMMKTLEASGVQFDKSMSVPENLAKRIAAQQVSIAAQQVQLNALKKNKKASGGFISDGSGTKDDVPALLMGGEYVISKPAVQKYGVDFMSRVNSGSLTGFARGGSVGDVAPLGSGGSSSTGGNEDLIESINNLSAKIQSQLDKTGGGAGGGAISNNIEININVSESGEVKGSNTSSGDEKAQGGDKKTSEEEKQEENKKRQELASMLQGMITQTLVKEQRKGGLLEK